MKRPKITPLPWKELGLYRDLTGRTVEVFRDCSFTSRMHHFIRGELTDLEWSRGKPSKLRFRYAKERFATRDGLQPWLPCELRSYRCNNPHPHNRENGSDEAWRCGKLICFRTPDEVDVAIYPQGVIVPEEPFFFLTQAQVLAHQKRLDRLLIQFAQRIGWR